MLQGHATKFILDEALNRAGADLENPDERPIKFAKIAVQAVAASQIKGDFEVVTGIVDGTDDTGIDAIAFVVDGKLIESSAQLAAALPVIRTDVAMHLVQVTESTSFRAEKVRTFLAGATDFFSANPSMKAHKGIRQFQALKGEIVLKTQTRPRIFLHYVCLGSEPARKQLVKKVQPEIDALKASVPFEDIQFIAHADDDILDLIRELTNRNTGTVSATELHERRINDAVPRRFIGELTISDIRQLVTAGAGTKDDPKRFKPNVFEDNVRGPLSGKNAINLDIKATLESPDVRYLPLLNHGLTIICSAATIDPTGKWLTLTNYQVVNGCQTSLAILESDEKLVDPNAFVKVTIAVTTDEKLKNQIILATNSQTPVSEEQKLSLLPINRSLKLFYDAMARDENAPKLEYEIRHGDRTNDDDYKRIRINNQLKSYVGMFLEKPHIAAHGIDKVRELIQVGLFGETNKATISYYAAGLTRYRFHRALIEGRIDRSMLTFQYHVFALVARANAQSDKPLIGQRIAVADTIKGIMWNEAGADTALLAAVGKVRKALETYPESKLVKASTQERFTHHLFQT